MGWIGENPKKDNIFINKKFFQQNTKNHKVNKQKYTRKGRIVRN